MTWVCDLMTVVHKAVKERPDFSDIVSTRRRPYCLHISVLEELKVVLRSQNVAARSSQYIEAVSLYLDPPQPYHSLGLGVEAPMSLLQYGSSFPTSSSNLTYLLTTTRLFRR